MTAAYQPKSADAKRDNRNRIFTAKEIVDMNMEHWSQLKTRVVTHQARTARDYFENIFELNQLVKRNQRTRNLQTKLL
jgi:hypothetical protein